MDIYDRVGAGDAFAAGIVHGLLSEHDLQKTIDYGVAHGALTMTTPGDNSMATVTDLERLLASSNAAAIR
jgi:2-dehydro-3-deoxygluconokinase